MQGSTGEVPLRQRLAALRARRGMPVLAGLGVAALLAAFFLTGRPSYTAESVVSFRPRDVATNDQVVKLLLSRYSAVGQSRQTVDAAARDVQLDASDLTGQVSVTNPPETANIRVAVTLPDSRRASAAANAISSVILFVAREDGLLVSAQVERAVPPRSASGASRPLQLLVAGLLGLGVAFAVSLAVDALRPRLWTRRQVRQLVGPETPLWLRTSSDRAATEALGAGGLRAVVVARAPATWPTGSARTVLVAGPGDPSRMEQGARLLAQALSDLGPVVLVSDDTPPARAPGGAGSDRGRAAGSARPEVEDGGAVMSIPRDAGTDSHGHLVLQRDAAYVVVAAGALLEDDRGLSLASSCDVVVLLMHVGDPVEPAQETLALCRDLGARPVVCGVDFGDSGARPTRVRPPARRHVMIVDRDPVDATPEASTPAATPAARR